MQVSKDLRECLRALQLGVKVTVLPRKTTSDIQDGLRRLQLVLQVRGVDFSTLSRYVDGVPVRFEDLASALQLCNGLQSMNLKCMYISERGIRELGKLCTTLTELCELNLASNGLLNEDAKLLCDALEPASLKRLDLRHNSIGADGCTNLSKCLGNCSTLQALNMENNPMAQTGVQSITLALLQRKPEKLTILNLNKVGMQAAGAAAFALVGELAALQEIHISQNKIGKEGLEALVSAFASWKSLQLLDLSRNELGPDSAKLLGGVLLGCRNLSNVYLRGNMLGDAGVEMIAATCGSHDQLSCLDMRSNEISAWGRAKIFGWIALCCKVKDLYLSHNHELRAAERQVFQHNFPEVPHLQELALEDCGLSQGYMDSFIKTTTRFQNLTCLNIGGNPVCGEHVQTLANGLAECTSLCELGLHRLKYGGNGMRDLAAKLMQLTRLTRLNLAGNHIGTAGSKHLARVLGACTDVGELDISDNNFNHRAVSTLFEGLHEWTRLKELNLCNNPLKDEGIRQLAPLLAPAMPIWSKSQPSCGAS